MATNFWTRPHIHQYSSPDMMPLMEKKEGSALSETSVEKEQRKLGKEERVERKLERRLEVEKQKLEKSNCRISAHLDIVNEKTSIIQETKEWVDKHIVRNHSLDDAVTPKVNNLDAPTIRITVIPDTNFTECTKQLSYSNTPATENVKTKPQQKVEKSKNFLGAKKLDKGNILSKSSGNLSNISKSFGHLPGEEKPKTRNLQSSMAETNRRMTNPDGIRELTLQKHGSKSIDRLAKNSMSQTLDSGTRLAQFDSKQQAACDVKVTSKDSPQRFNNSHDQKNSDKDSPNIFMIKSNHTTQNAFNFVGSDNDNRQKLKESLEMTHNDSANAKNFRVRDMKSFEVKNTKEDWHNDQYKLSNTLTVQKKNFGPTLTPKIQSRKYDQTNSPMRIGGI